MPDYGSYVLAQEVLISGEGVQTLNLNSLRPSTQTCALFPEAWDLNPKPQAPESP